MATAAGASGGGNGEPCLWSHALLDESQSTWWCVETSFTAPTSCRDQKYFDVLTEVTTENLGRTGYPATDSERRIAD